MLVDRDVVDLSLHWVMELHHRAVSREQLRRFEGYLAEIFAACGLNLHTPATEETPRRFLQAPFEATEGSDGEPKLLKVFDTECRGNPDGRLGQVIEGPIPFFGHAHIGYLPHTSIMGISKLTRLVRLFARRFTVQERLGEQMVHACDAMLQPHGVARSLQAHHLCVEMRGVRDTRPVTQMTVWRGDYEHNPSLRVEFLLACGAQR